MNRAGGLFTKLNLHLAGVGLVLALDIFLGVRFALAWRAIRADQSSEFVGQQLRYGQLRAQMQHLNGLPEKVDAADTDAQTFYDKRVAPNYSTMLAQLMGTAEKDHVQLSRSGYAQETAIPGLTEVSIDAGLSGQYSEMVHFINDLERDKDHVFFLIDGITLTGEQGGMVNLRLRLKTYLRSNATDLPAAANGGAAAGATNNGGAR
jgi:type IV pilus assembly protein PilO